MFEETSRLLQQLKSGMQINIPIREDERGFLDKECPNSECLFQFKVHAEDWKQIFRDEAVFCPRCRYQAPARSWFTTEQVEHVHHQGIEHIRGLLGGVLHADAQRFNRSQPRGGFITMSLGVSAPSGPPVVLPANSAEALRLDAHCEACRARYAVLGPAFFCPSCGSNSADRYFDLSLAKVRAKLDSIGVVQGSLAGVGRREDAAHTVVSLIETSISDCVTAFQRLCEMLYSSIPGVPMPQRNVFQRLDQASELWEETIQFSYATALAPVDWNELKVLFQKRHLLVHQDGVVDQTYLDRSGDRAYSVGQRMVIKENDARQLLRIITDLADKLRAAVRRVTSSAT
jgi:hypothetical protein